MLTVVILWAIADALLLAGLIIMVFCPLYEGEKSWWQKWRRK